MIKRLPKFFLFLLASFFVINTLSAATIKGIITDANTKETLIGASIVLRKMDSGKDLSTLSLLDGSFEFKNLQPGNYVLKVSYVSYLSQNKEITVKADQFARQDFWLLPDASTSLTEVKIDALQDGASENTARNMERNASQVMNIVSGKMIELSPDLTVANVIQRISGVSVERSANGDGQYAIIRGMDKRYNYTTVNGIKIPSPDNKSRYVPLDIFPSELLDRLEVYKALTPDMEGDAIGGAVNMKMKDAPDRLTLAVNIAAGYSEIFADRPYLSFDKDAVNALSPYERYGKAYQAKPSDFPKGLVDYQPKNFTPNMTGGIAYGNRFLDKKLGLMLTGSYQNTYRGNNSLFNESDVYADERTSRITSMSTREYSEEQTRYGLHAKLDYTVNPKLKFQWYNAYLKLVNTQTRNSANGLLNEPDRITGITPLGFSSRSRYSTQQIYNSTLQSDQKLADKLSLQWSAVYSVATNQTPDNTTINIGGERKDGVVSKTYFTDATRRWEHNRDEDLAGYLNLTYEPQVAGKPVVFKVGGLYRDKKRSNFYNNYTLNPDAANNDADYSDYTTINWLVFNPLGSVGSALTYHASEDVSAGYGSAKVNLADLEVLGGVRVEHTNQGYMMDYPAGELRPDGQQSYTDILPSINLKYVHWKNKNLRASYFRSINRPGFFEIVPYKIVNEDYEERGNPDIKHAIADNYDLRFELFPNKTDQLLIGAFYKFIKDPIEYTLQKDETRGQNIYLSPGNFGNAKNYGFEIDFIKYFKKFGIKGNYTFTESQITTSKFIRIRDANGDLLPDQVNQTRPLSGQSAHIGNLILMYKDGTGWNGQIGASYTGERINTVSQFLDNDLWQKGYVQLDLSLEKKFKKGISVFAKANNLLNTPSEVYIKNANPANEGKPYQRVADGETLISRDYYQRTYLLGIRYKLFNQN